MSDPVSFEQQPTSTPQGPLAVRGPSMYATTSPSSATGSGGALAWNLLKGLYRRWRQAAVFGVLAATAVGLAVWFLLPPPLPSATARVRIYQHPPTRLGEHPDPPVERGTQIVILRSYLVLSAALRDPAVASLPAIVKVRDEGLNAEEWLAKNLTVDFAQSPEVMSISLSHEDPEQAKALVHAVTNSYLDEVKNKSEYGRTQRLRDLQDMLVTAESALKRHRESAARIAVNSVSSDPKALLIHEQLTRASQISARADLLDVTNKLKRWRREKEALADLKGGANELPPRVIDDLVEQDVSIRQSLGELTALEEKLKLIRESAVNPEATMSYTLAKKALADHKSKHDELISISRKRIQEQARTQSAADIAFRIRLLEENIKYNEGLERLLTKEVEESEKGLKKLNKQTEDLEPIRLEIKLAEDLFSRIKAAITALEIERTVDPRIDLLEPARINTVDAERRKQFLAGIGALAALAGVLAMVGLREVSQRRVDSPDSVAAGLGLPIVGMIPRHPSRLARVYGNADDPDWQAGMIESINCTRTMLLHGEGLTALKVVQITSPVGGEGKTTLSTHLALSVALAGRRTLLIDGDLRNPNAHRPFNLPDGPGLCELLRGETTMAEALHPSTIAGLTVMPGGRWMDGTQQALASTGLDGIFEQIRSEFDFVVVDSSPVLPLTDPLLLARHVDGVIVSLLQGVSRLPLVQEANQRMSVLGVRVLGAVLNGTAHRKYGYGSAYVAPLTTA